MSESLEALQARLAKIKKARDSGVLSVSHNGSSTTFRSLAEMDKIIAGLEGDVDAAAGAARPRRTRYAYQRDKGL